jgi:tetratricopeptide (TPR) repeat protein
MMTTQTPEVSVFLSYAHEDEVWLRRLLIHLSLLQRQGVISAWYDRQILPGTAWARVIDQHLEDASIILFLVSADFLASDYCYEVEMKRALERHEVGQARVIPVAVRSVGWDGAPFAHLQALPTNARAMSTWPDADAACVDVVAGIRRAIEDLSFAPASTLRHDLPPIWNIPYPHNSFFQGREDVLTHLHTLLLQGQCTALSQSPHALSGLGGIGKTQLATEYAYRYHQEYEAVLWARAEDRVTLLSSYLALATLLHLPEREAREPEEVVAAVKTWLQNHQKWLLILDNTDDLTVVPAFLPPIIGGHVLLTTRAWDMQRVATRCEVQALSEEQGAILLARRAGLLTTEGEWGQLSLADRRMAMVLAHRLGGLPLALDQAGAYMEATGCSLEEYGQLYQTYQLALLQDRRSGVPDHPEGVMTTWSLSFQRVQEKQPAAADLLRLCAFLASDGIAEEILTAQPDVLGTILAPLGNDALQRAQAIEALRTYSLIQRDPKEKLLSIHRLVQAVLADGQNEAERRIWAERAMLAVDAAFPWPEHATWKQCERLLAQALHVSERMEQDGLTTWEAGHLLHASASYLSDHARYAEAEPLYQQALHIREQSQGPDHPDVASPLNGLAILYFEQGKYQEAEPLYQRALHIREQSLGPDHPDVASPLNGLANLYSEQGKYREAEPLSQRALHIWEQSQGPDHPAVASLLNNLANLYFEQGKYQEAEPLSQRALHIWEQSLGPDHPQVASPLNGLANLYFEQDKYQEAEPLSQRALHIRGQSQGPDHPLTQTARRDYARLLRVMKREGEAKKLEEKA